VNWTIPNLLSVFRMALVPLFVAEVLDANAARALAVFLAAGVTDALDGFIARIWGQQSALGAYLDPIADKLLLVTAYVTLAIPQANATLFRIPYWVSALVLTRDVVIVIMALVLYLVNGIRRFPPSPVSKVNTAIQVATVVIVLAAGIRPHLEVVATGAIYAVAASTLLSGLDYLFRANRMSADARP